MLRALRHTYIHTRCMPGVWWGASDIHTYTLRALGHTYIHTGTGSHTYTLNTVSSYDVCMSETYMHTCSVCLRHTYIHAQLPETCIHICSVGASNVHTCMHTYTLAWACQTYIHTYMLRVGLELRHIYIHVWSLARLPEVPSLTIQKKKINVRFWRVLIRNLTPSQRSWFCSFEWDIHTYMLRSLRHTYIHTYTSHTYIDTCSGFSDIHTYIHTYIHTRLQTHTNPCIDTRVHIWFILSC